MGKADINSPRSRISWKPHLTLIIIRKALFLICDTIDLLYFLGRTRRELRFFGNGLLTTSNRQQSQQAID